MKYIIGMLVLGYIAFTAAGVKTGHPLAEVVRMSGHGVKRTLPLIAILLLIGMMTGLWRDCGTIVTFVYYFGIVSEATMAFKALIIILVIVLQSEPVRQRMSKLGKKKAKGGVVHA